MTRFISDERLEEIYNSHLGDISPTDTPQAEYISEQSVVSCPKCNRKLETFCSGSPTVEHAYCEGCMIQLTRQRARFISDIDYEYHHKRIDEREEYICDNCKESHMFTVPKDGWSYIETPTITSQDIDSNICCPCGSRISLTGVELPNTIPCANCKRVYSFGIGL